jgi:hypothetical protein
MRLLLLAIILTVARAFRDFGSAPERARKYFVRQELSALSSNLKPQLSKLIDRQDLTSEETEDVWNLILSGCEEALVGAILTLLRSKGETPSEIAGGADFFNEFACITRFYLV